VSASETETSFAVRDTAERSKNRTSFASTIRQQFRAVCKALAADDPEPRPKEKKKTDSGGLRLAAAALITRLARRCTANIRAAMRAGFCRAAQAITAGGTDIPAEAYGEAAPALDAANPYWEFSVDSDDGADCSAARCGASLDL
jgi:hypothetical protein